MRTGTLSLYAFVVYILTAFLLIFTAYSHLDYATDGITDIDLEILIEMFPIFFLFVGLIILIISATISLGNPVLASKLSVVGSFISWAYYLPMLCFFSVFNFTTIRGLLIFGLPMISLLVTIWLARRVQIANR